MEKNIYEKVITKPELSFWIPIIISVISIVISFMALSTKVDLLTQKQDMILVQLTQQSKSFESVELMVMNNSLRVTVLETLIAGR